MKQSTKLLSLLLAVLMSISCFSVIGSAALDKSAINYDIIDDADLTYEQVSNLYKVYAFCTITRVKSFNFTYLLIILNLILMIFSIFVNRLLFKLNLKKNDKNKSVK